MAEFDPDAYLGKSGFDPDAYLGAKPSAKAAPTLGKLDRFGKGLRDPVDAGAQLLTNMLPSGVVSAGNRLNNWLAENTGLVGKLPEGGVDQQVREQEKAYQSARGEGFDAMRLAGNVLNPANLAIAAKLPQAATLGGRMLVGAGGGAASSIFSPVTEGDFATEKAKQAGIGAVGGGVVPAIGGGIARVVSPKNTTDPAMMLLRAEGVKPTLGQTLGGAWNKAEERLQTALPITGDAIVHARSKARDQFNQAAINRALDPIGAKVNGVGHEAVKEAGDILSDTFERGYKMLGNFQVDPAATSALSTLKRSTAMLPKSERAAFNEMWTKYQNALTPQKHLLPDDYAMLREGLGKKAAEFGGSNDAYQRQVSGAFKQMNEILEQNAERANPAAAELLSKAREGWANLVRVEGAATSAKGTSGVFTPGQLLMAVKAGDKSVRDRATGRGTAFMQDLAGSGQSVLGNKVPDSGTAGRAAYGLGALGLGTINPAIPAGLLGGAALYTPPMQSLLTTLVGRRPQVAEPIAETIRRLSPALSPMSAQIGLLQ